MKPSAAIFCLFAAMHAAPAAALDIVRAPDTPGTPLKPIGEGVASTAVPPATQPAADLPDISPLIAQLSDDAWPRRQAAEEELVRLGPPIRPLLEHAVDETDNLEVRVRLRTILGRIERERTVGMSRITLDMTDVGTSEVLAEISRQAGAPIRLQGSGMKGRRGSFHFHDEPFWNVMTEVCRTLDLFPYDAGREPGLHLSQHNAQRLAAPSVVHGPFMVLLGSVNHTHQIQLAMPNVVRSHSTLQMTLLAEPKLKVLGRSYQPINVEAIDENGKSLTSPVDRGGHYSTGGGNVWPVNLHLSPEASNSQRLATLKGAIEVLIQVRSHTIEAGDLANMREQSHSVGPNRVVLHELTERDGNHILRVTIFHGAGGQTLTDGGQSLVQGLRIYDGRDRLLSFGGFHGRNMDNQKAEYEINLGGRSGRGEDSASKPAKLIWTIPVETRSVRVPFEFHDVPLQ